MGRRLEGGHRWTDSDVNRRECQLRGALFGARSQGFQEGGSTALSQRLGRGDH